MKEVIIREITDKRTANAFLFGNILNQQQSSARSFNGQYILEHRIGSIDPESIIKYPFANLVEQMQTKPAIHPMAKTMSERLVKACEILLDPYEGDARNIWENKNAEEILERLQEFPGIGEHKALVALYFLAEYLYKDISNNKKINIAELCPHLEYTPIVIA